jgi:hypothetical protein
VGCRDNALEGRVSAEFMGAMERAGAGKDEDVKGGGRGGTFRVVDAAVDLRDCVGEHCRGYGWLDVDRYDRAEEQSCGVWGADAGWRHAGCDGRNRR